MVSEQLIRFLREEIAVPDTAIDFALRHHEQDISLLPMTLWQYGLVTLEQLEKILDRLSRFP